MIDYSMRKSFADYEAYIFDLDGTLYYQRQLRLTMAKRLACFYLIHPFRVKELLIVKKFREIREHWDELDDKIPATDAKSIDNAQYEYVADKMMVSPSMVESVIQKWIYDNPLDALKNSKDRALADIILKIRSKEKRVIIFSDYPVEDKLSALGIEADACYCSAFEPIEVLKPSPKGIEVILSENNILAENAIMVGDRFEKDGLSAKGAGVDYVILSKNPKHRTEFYNSLSV